MKQFLNINGYIFDFELVVRNMHNKIIKFNLCEEKSRDNYYVFNSTDKTYKGASAVVSLEEKDGVSAIKFFCDTDPHCGYDVCHYLAAYDTAEIRLIPSSLPDSVLASIFHIGIKSDCWTKPCVVKNFSDIPKRAISVAWKHGTNHYHMLPLCHNSAKTDIKVVDGVFSLTVSPYRSGYAKIDSICAVIACDPDPFAAAKNAVDGGYDFLGRRRSTEENTRVSEIFDYLGWCSWDSMHTEVNEVGIIKKAEEFNEKGIPVRWILIDDGWYGENDKREAVSFYEDKRKFPHGLKYCVEKLKKENGLKYVGIWEALGGGWGGIAPDSEIVREHSDKIFKLPNGKYFPRVDEGGAFAFWNMRHSYLAGCGFDFVKIDVESSVEASVHGVYSVAEASEGMYKGIDGSVGIYFDGACINCTGMGADGLWNRPVGMVNRNSEDFVPTRVSTMSNFVCCNIYNSLWHSNFCATDWDMMWSHSPTTKMNIVMHAISGASVYLSDPHDRSRAEYILPFCLSDGRLLKADRYAMPTEDCLYRDPSNEEIPLKGWTMSGKCGLIGAFNTYRPKAKTISGALKPSDVKYIEGEKFIVYDYFAKTAVILKRDEEYLFDLEEYGAKLFLVVPFEGETAVLGDCDKYVSPAIIEDEIHTDNSVIYILKEGGRFTFAGNISSASVNGCPTEIHSDGMLLYVDCSEYTGKTIIELK